MFQTQPLTRFLVVFVFTLGFLPQSVRAQSASALAAKTVDSGPRVTLAGNVHPLARPQYDHGAVPDSTPAARLLLLLRRSPQQEAALQEFLQQIHRPGTSSFHAWLKPQEFASKFGPSDADVAAVASWLKSQGFTNL